MLKKKTASMGKPNFILLVIITLLVGGCFEEKSEYTINPDLSGKATFDLILTPFIPDNIQQGSDFQEMIKPEIEKMLLSSKGIDTWKDISFELTDEGFIHFIGTAYFPNINELYLNIYDIPENSGFLKLLFSKDPSGRIILAAENPYNTDNVNEVRTTELSEEELTQQVRITKLRYNQSKPSMQAMFGSLKLDSLFHLPAKIEEISSFEKIDDTTIRIKWQGSQIFEALDKMMADDEMLKNLIREGRNPFSDTFNESFNSSIIFGQKGPMQAVLSSDSEKLFDYEAEVADAKSNYNQMIKELGLVLTKPEPIRTEAPVVSTISLEPGKIRVVGVRLVKYSDYERDIKPFSQFDKGYALSLMLDLPEPNLLPIKNYVEKAITDTGQDILSNNSWRTPYPELSRDGNTAVFEVNLSVPDKGTKTITELSGKLEYSKSTGTKTIDLGLMDFADGTRSQVKGFSIKSIRNNSWDRENTEMVLDVDLPRGHLISTKFYNEDGSEIEVSKSGESFSEIEIFDLHYKVKGKFPPKGRIVLEVMDNITKHEINFKLTNISLMGDPL